MTRAEHDVDVAVIGAGPAGTAAAVTLRRAGVRVALLTGPRRPGRAAIGQSAPPGTDRVARDVFGARGFEAAEHLRSLGNRSAWGDGDPVLTDFMFNPFGTGWHLDRVAFDARLVACAADVGVDVLHGATVERTIWDGGWEVTARTAGAPFTVRAARVCDASGRRAVVARTHGARLVHRDRLVAVVSSAPRAPGDHDHTSLVEAGADGWWYTAPCPGGTRAFVWFTDPDLLDRRLSTSPDGFADAVRRSRHVATHLGGPLEVPAVVPAGTAHLDAPTGRGWVAAGDAVATFDPLSSQGIVTALLTGRDAARAVLGDLGGEPTTGYERQWRRVLDAYADERATWYAAETRFPESSFWNRRGRRRAA